MRIIADLHLHSKYSRACSKDLDLEGNSAWAKKKGIQIVGSGDFTHPAWFKELQGKLIEEKPGLYKLKGSTTDVFFMLTTELSCIYKQGGKVRRIHLCIFAPDLETVGKIIKALEKRGVNLRSDGRPIMGLSAEELTKIVLDANENTLMIPAHIWTPWFSVFGSYSGFDSLEECFGSQTKYIYTVETGLSSDPLMNFQVSALDNLTLISNSDAHSPRNLGREANVFEIDEKELSYGEIRRILKDKDAKKFLYTIEFFPEEGKYHSDGHADCQVSLTPVQTKKHKGLCPVCKKPLTIGVWNRVDQLASRKFGTKPKNFIPYKHVVPLQEVMAESFGVGKNSKKVQAEYDRLVEIGGSEFAVLLDRTYEELQALTTSEVALAINNVRQGMVEPIAGYDGVFGIIKIFKDGQIIKPRQSKLI